MYDEVAAIDGRTAGVRSDGPVALVLDRLGGRRGLVDGALPPVAFLATHAFAGLVAPATALRSATVAALVTGAALLGSRLVRREPLGPAMRGMAGLVVAAAFAALSGDARDFFLPGIYVDAAYAVALAGSVAVGHPLVGHGYALLFGFDGAWRRDPRLRRVLVTATLGWSAVSAVRAAVQTGLYRAHLTELLAVAKLGLGWPLTAAGVVLTVAAVRRARRAAEPEGAHCRTTGPGQSSPPPSYQDPTGVDHVRSTAMNTVHELAELGERLAEEGPARYERTLQEVASAVADRAPGVAAALRDPSAADVLRLRAFALASMVLQAQPRRQALQPSA